jgi:hypothetical protein
MALPLLPDLWIDEPSPSDTLETWERHLTELKSQSPSVMGNLAVGHAERQIQRMKAEQDR